jgi:DNA modification methylase
MYSWSYTSELPVSLGYEKELKYIYSFTPEMYAKADKDGKDEIVQKLFEVYRGRNIYPIYYYNEEGIRNEIQACIDKDVREFDGINLTKRNLQGSDLCRFMYRNLEHVDVGTAKKNSMWDRFFDDKKLKKAIHFCLRFEVARPRRLLSAMQLIGGGVATNFHPMKAKAIYEYYCPEKGIIYDYASGFGGRLLGALSSKKNFYYVGVDPNTETIHWANELAQRIENVTGRKKSYILKCKGSEDYRPPKDSVDFAFSSPPYFNLEKYTNEPTQAYIRFPELDSWFENYVKKTVENIYYTLKPNRNYAVNIADFNLGSRRIEYVDRWLKISEEVGFEYLGKVNMKVTTRRGSGHNDLETGKSIPKQEGIFLFRKEI